MSQSSVFNLYSRYYDLLYKDKNYKEESAYLVKKISSLNNGARRILELGCGTGNHASFLCDAGYHVTGLERSAEMVSLAKKKGLTNFEPLVADITNFELSQKFDVAVSLFHVISYLNTNDDLIACFKSTHRHLNEGGLFIFDVWYTPAVYHLKPETRVKRISDQNFEVTRLAEPVNLSDKHVIEVNYEIIIRDNETKQTEVFKEKHPMRHFSIPEIQLLATHTNFKLLATEEFMTGNKAGENTWGVCFILKAQ